MKNFPACAHAQPDKFLQSSNNIVCMIVVLAPMHGEGHYNNYIYPPFFNDMTLYYYFVHCLLHAGLKQ